MPHIVDTITAKEFNFVHNVLKLFFKIFLLGQDPFCGVTDCPYFGLCVTLPMGFKARAVLLPVLLLACMQ